ncbi:FAD/NAD(P)-binding domain-containing protein [Parathielavia appendiculata]|uniref:FAD/NAD(P)-binding domain-containing protein n=1 Tax=Parathielavia appendiculata TaxID=2587402 RepID=A0AAN6U696_9PEZI|nr:FAD/NAD(P)-binding domain-containing protein [Parathielavia appendiculata]
MDPVALRVLISGGGVAGSALAFWLVRQGHDIPVVEHFTSLRAFGLHIDLRGPGTEAAPEQGMQIPDFEFEIMRGNLCRLHYDAANACRTPPKYVFGTSVASFEQKDTSVNVRFEDGRTDTFDLLVNADGQWSRTRRMMLGPGIPDAVQRIPALYMAYFTVRQPMQKGEKYLTTPEEMQVLLTCNPAPDWLENVFRGNVEKDKEAFADIFRGAKWISEDILKSMWAADDFYCERLGLVKLKSWSSGHVTLVGEAAHCPTALSGMALLALLTQTPLPLRSTATNKPFRPFVKAMQEGIPERAEKQWNMTGSAFSIGVLNFMVGIASFLKVNIADLMGIRETVGDGYLPDYESMVGDK